MKTSVNPGCNEELFQVYEKLISGMYLGELFRQVAKAHTLSLLTSTR